MIDIGINYITELDMPYNKYDNVYQILKQGGYINTIKYPGKYCDCSSLKSAIHLANTLDLKIDIHGLPGMVAAIYSDQFLKEIDWKSIKEIFSNQKINRFTTHMGLESGDKLSNYTSYQLASNWNTNVDKLKSNMKEIFHKDIEFGVENIPGGFQYDLKMLTPEFIDDNWLKADFGVFDISHAKLAATTLGISYQEYLEKIKQKERVKIIHVSGNIDQTNQLGNKPDKHTLIHEEEIQDIINALEIFNHVDLVVSEYGYCTKYSYSKELTIEAITLYNIVKSKDVNSAKKVLKFLEENLKDDISNIQDIIEDKELKSMN